MVDVVAWNRFWSPRGTDIEPGLDGYLPDPEDGGEHYNPELREFSRIADRACLVLLGEPGAGKTTTLRPRLSHEATGHRWLDLKAYSDEARLVDRLTELVTRPVPSDAGGVVTLTLDSFDECLIRIETLASLLPEELATVSRDKLRLRIICRPSVWPSRLEAALIDLWPSVDVFKLAPLRRRDVADAAQAAGVDPDAFIAAVRAQQVQPLASQPVSLDLLLRLFRDSASALPTDRRDLYLRGCLALLQFVSEARRGTSLEGRLTPRQRLAIAGRLAALSMLCGRPHIGADSLPDDVAVLAGVDVTGGAEHVDDRDVEVTLDAVREVLDKPLFTPAGPGILAFAHRTYAEYLAAWYLHERGFATPQVIDLVTDESSRGTVVPQLREVVSWLASMNDGVRRDLLPIDPSLAVDDAVATSSDAFKAQIVAALLDASDQRRIVDWDIPQPRRLAALKYPGIANQLRAPISNNGTFFVTRRLALNVATHCRVTELSDELASVALDKEAQIDIRRKAAGALTTFGTREAKHRMRPLLVEGGLDEGHDELRGHALRCVWPDLVSTHEVFERFAQPSWSWSEHVEFLQELVGQLQGLDLIPALNWVSRQPRRFGSSIAVARMINSCLVRATKQVAEHAELGRPLAYAVLSRLLVHEHVLSSDQGEDDDPHSAAFDEDDRRRLVTLLVVCLDGDTRMPDVVWGSDLLTAGDRWWLLARCRNDSAREEEKERWLGILEDISRMPDASDDVAFLDEVMTFACVDADAKRRLGFLAPVEIDSAVAREARARHERWRAIDAERAERRERKASQAPFDRASAVKTALDEPTEDPVDDWLYLTNAIVSDDDGRCDTHRVDVATASGWRDLSESTRARVLQVALELLEALTPPAGWTSLERVPHQVLAGYRALRLLAQVDPMRLEQLTGSAWARWAETILGWWFDDGKEARSTLLRLAQRSAPTALVEAVRLVGRGERTRKRSFHFTYRLAGLWDEALTEAALIELSHEDVPTDAFGHGLAEMLKGSALGARSFAVRLVTVQGDPRADMAAALLLAHSGDPPWSSIWLLMSDSVDRGSRILSLALEANRHLRFSRHLSAEDAANFYIWLARIYPPADDPRHPSVYTPTSRDHFIELRNAIVSELAARGTEDSYRQVLRIQTEVPHPTDFTWTVLSAHRALVERRWRPIAPEHLLAMARDSRRRTIRSAADLSDLVRRALEQVQERLQGKTAENEQLWDEQRNGKKQARRWRPKDEASLSNYIKNRLEELIGGWQLVLNREVELRRGQESDIYIQAVPHRPSKLPAFAVVIEVKGCWNAGLMQSMHTQLQERYLENLSNTHGVYLVGWFVCPQWITTDRRWKQSPKRTIEDLRGELAGQARDLTARGTPIHSFVLDVRLHGKPEAKSARRRPRVKHARGGSSGAR